MKLQEIVYIHKKYIILYYVIININMSLLHHIYALFIIILLFVCLHRPSERTDEDIQLIYDELLHVKAFSHLSNAVSNTHTHTTYMLIRKHCHSLYSQHVK